MANYGILTGREIQRQIELNAIQIDPFRREHINPASVDLTLGEEVAVYEDWVICNERLKTTYEDGRYFVLRPGACMDIKREPVVKKYKMDKNGWRLNPGIGYLMHTAERIKTDEFVPVLDGKSSIGRLFIKVHETAGYGDPGFNGQYTLEVTAMHPIVIYPGMRFCQMRFHTKVGTNETYQKSGHYTGATATGPIGSYAWKQFPPSPQ